MSKLDRLSLLYENILTAVSRVRIGKQAVKDLEDFRTRMEQALAEVEGAAARRGYAPQDIEESKFAVVAFIDEAILTSAGESAGEWVGNTLGQKYFQQRSQGEQFFSHLEKLRASRDSEPLAEVLEVYYYCLLLGYEGKYADSAKGELLQIIGNVRQRMETIFGADAEFSPDKSLPVEPPRPVVAADLFSRQLRWFALAAIAFALLCYIAFSFQLGSQRSELERAVDQRISGGGAQ